MYSVDSGGLYTGACIWSVCIGMYKLNRTSPWRCSWKVNLRTVAVALYSERQSSCSIPRYESSVFTRGLPCKYEIILVGFGLTYSTKNRDQIFLIEIFLLAMVCNLTTLSDFTPGKTFVLLLGRTTVSLDKQGTGDSFFFRKINKKQNFSQVRPGL